MIGDYLTQDAVLRRRTGVAASGTPTYEDVPIKCLFGWGARLVAGSNGQQVTARGLVFTKTKVLVGDAIQHEGRDWPVITSYERIGLGGVINHYEVFI